MSLLTHLFQSDSLKGCASAAAYRKCQGCGYTVKPPPMSFHIISQIFAWNIQLIVRRLNFLENCVGDDVSMLICDSHSDCQWRSGLMLSVGQNPPQKPRCFQLTWALEIWWANLYFSYCTSHFSYQNSGCEFLLQFLYAHFKYCNKMYVCLAFLRIKTLICWQSFHSRPKKIKEVLANTS